MTGIDLALLGIGLLVGFIAGCGWGYSAGLQRMIGGDDAKRK